MLLRWANPALGLLLPTSQSIKPARAHSPPCGYAFVASLSTLCSENFWCYRVSTLDRHNLMCNVALQQSNHASKGMLPALSGLVWSRVRVADNIACYLLHTLGILKLYAVHSIPDLSLLLSVSLLLSLCLVIKSFAHCLVGFVLSINIEQQGPVVEFYC